MPHLTLPIGVVRTKGGSAAHSVEHHEQMRLAVVGFAVESLTFRNLSSPSEYRGALGGCFGQFNHEFASVLAFGVFVDLDRNNFHSPRRINLIHERE